MSLKCLLTKKCFHLKHVGMIFGNFYWKNECASHQFPQPITLNLLFPHQHLFSSYPANHHWKSLHYAKIITIFPSAMTLINPFVNKIKILSLVWWNVAVENILRSNNIIRCANGNADNLIRKWSVGSLSTRLLFCIALLRLGSFSARAFSAKRLPRIFALVLGPAAKKEKPFLFVCQSLSCLKTQLESWSSAWSVSNLFSPAEKNLGH